MVELQRRQQQQDTQLNTQKDYAYYLTKNAEMNVFVLRNNPPQDRKRPVYDWTIYQTACPTLAQIDKWFDEENPDYNIAVPMGFSSGCIAFDIDGPIAKQRIEEVRLKMSANLRPVFDNTMMNKTGSGGMHLVFRLEDYNDMMISKISTKELWKDNNEHSQIKMQANGAYIMFAHSLHPNGNFYEWNGKAPALLTENELLELIRLITGRSNERIPLNWSLEGKYDNESNTSNTSYNNNNSSNFITNAPAETIQGLYDWTAPYYLPGDRNDIIYHLSGHMRKDGAFTLADCETLATMLCEMSEYRDENLEETLEKVRRSFKISIEKLKGKSGLFEKLIQNIDVESMSDEDLDKRHATYNKICDIVSKNAKRNRPETLIEGCTIMELAGANSNMYMTVLSKDNHEDKVTDSIRPVRLVAPLYPVKDKKDETKKRI